MKEISRGNDINVANPQVVVVANICLLCQYLFFQVIPNLEFREQNSGRT